MFVNRLILIIVAIFCAFMCEGRRVNSLRGKLQLKVSETTQLIKSDTIYDDFSEIKITGFEKAQNSSVESFFIINRSHYYIKGINLSIEYINLKKEQLHLNTIMLDCDIPPEQTRSLQMRAWDRQHLWYYVGSQGKHNDYCNPFDVRIRINYLIAVPDSIK